MVTDKTRREAFITQNLGLVHACAGRFRGRGMEYDDLYSAGCVGLIKAYDNFDESRGVCFSTYAVPVILGEIKKLFRDGGTVKVSRSLKELSLKISAVRERCVKETGQEPTVSQLAERLDVTPEQVADAMSAGERRRRQPGVRYPGGELRRNRIRLAEPEKCVGHADKGGAHAHLPALFQEQNPK